MRLKIAVYNVEWMRRLFDSNGGPITTGDEKTRSERLAKVINEMSPDIMGVVEGPDTLVDGSKTASGQLEKWVSKFNLSPNYKAVHGYPSNGQQELCALYDETKVKVSFKPETNAKNPFDKPFLVDTTDSLIKEHYKHYRPPLELLVTDANDENNRLTRIIVTHTKSKGIFKKVDMARFEQISERDRKKLYAECISIRERCNEWLAKGENVIVMGDVNDGAGMDIYENRFKKSALETLLGDVWNPELILKSVVGRPKPDQYGWTPSSSSFKDKITKDTFNVLIDHILVSQKIKVVEGAVWNPHLENSTQNIKALKNDLNKASDHYPILAEIEI
ncbi:MAG: hypothetical protein A7316_08820 [Candidatus Altiarchaeales archaeon WOR_SM1_86-2]|nr:MAG: hypothetical protein A7316_08820 [Candidatus Altiarchaeales archaeon WOR_SM1_86-2]